MLAGVSLRCRLPSFLAVGVAFLLVAVPSASAARDRCAAPGSKTVKQNTAVRRFSTTRKGTSRFYACLRSTGRRVRVAITINDSESLSSGHVRTVLIAGTSVAVVSAGFEDIGVDGAEFEDLAVANLARGGRAYRTGISTNEEDQYGGFGTV